MNRISNILKLPTDYIDNEGNCHESTLRAWHILELVKEMLKRNDSTETILEVINYIETANFTKEA